MVTDTRKVNPRLPAQRPPACERVRVAIAAEEEGLEEQHAGGPDRRCAAEPGRIYLPISGWTRKSRKALRNHYITYRCNLDCLYCSRHGGQTA